MAGREVRMCIVRIARMHRHNVPPLSRLQ